MLSLRYRYFKHWSDPSKKANHRPHVSPFLLSVLDFQNNFIVPTAASTAMSLNYVFQSVGAKKS